MEDKDKQQLPEAPASATVKIKSAAGFEWLFTIRDEKTSVLMFKIKSMEAKWISLGWTPLAQNTKGGFSQKPIDYVPNRTCPNDGARLINATKKDGSKYIRCENNKWINGQQSGCKFVEWPNHNTIPTRQINEGYEEF